MLSTQPETFDAGASREPLRIGPLVVDPPLLQAPMAGFSNHAYRQIVRRFGGAGLPTTEMVSARGFLEIDALGDTLPERLWGVREEPRPLAVQLWDNDPAILAAVGARLAHELNVSVVDINLGCPVKAVCQRAQSGSYLLRYPDRVGAIVESVVAACRPVPVTAKIRRGPGRQTINATDVAQAVEGAGGAAVTVHGRTADQGLRGTADWDQIARVKLHLKRMPLIGNGDVQTARAAVEALSRWGVDGVMIGRAGLARPWLFCQARAALAGEPIPADPTLDQQRQLLLNHYRRIVERFGPEKGTILMRRFACRYRQGQPGARLFRTKVARVSTPEEFIEIVEG